MYSCGSSRHGALCAPVPCYFLRAIHYIAAMASGASLARGIPHHSLATVLRASIEILAEDKGEVEVPRLIRIGMRAT